MNGRVRVRMALQMKNMTPVTDLTDLVEAAVRRALRECPSELGDPSANAILGVLTECLAHIPEADRGRICSRVLRRNPAWRCLHAATAPEAAAVVVEENPAHMRLAGDRAREAKLELENRELQAHKRDLEEQLRTETELRRDCEKARDEFALTCQKFRKQHDQNGSQIEVLSQKNREQECQIGDLKIRLEQAEHEKACKDSELIRLETELGRLRRTIGKGGGPSADEAVEVSPRPVSQPPPPAPAVAKEVVTSCAAYEEFLKEMKSRLPAGVVISSPSEDRERRLGVMVACLSEMEDSVAEKVIGSQLEYYGRRFPRLSVHAEEMLLDCPVSAKRWWWALEQRRRSQFAPEQSYARYVWSLTRMNEALLDAYHAVLNEFVKICAGKLLDPTIRLPNHERDPQGSIRKYLREWADVSRQLEDACLEELARRIDENYVRLVSR
jgi:hypothetical protein